MSLPGGKPPKKPPKTARIIRIEATVIPIAERIFLKNLIEKLRRTKDAVQKVRKSAKVIEIGIIKKKK